MGKLQFIIIVFNGKGWITPIKDLLLKTKFQSVIIDLYDLKIFTLSDIFLLKNKGLLGNKLNHLNLSFLEREELENILNDYLEKLIKYENLKNKILKFSILSIILIWIGFVIIDKVIENYKSKESEIINLQNSIERKENGIKIVDKDLEKVLKDLEDCK